MKHSDEKKRGRRKLPALEKAIRHALAARRRYLELVEQRKAMLAIKPGDAPEDVLDKKMVAEKRLETARLAEKRRLLARTAKDDHEVIRVQEEEKAYRTELNCLPPLGYGYKEWLSLSPDEVKRPVGKQPMAIELQLCRAQLEWEAAQQEFKEEAKRAGLRSVDLELFQDPAAKEHSGRVGRPPLDDLGELDAKIRHYERRISEVKALPDTAFLQSALGRKPIAKNKRIKSFQRKISLLEQEIAAKETELGSADVLRRRRKRLWNERFILANTSLHELSDRAKTRRLNAINEEMAALDIEIDKLYTDE